MPSNENKKTKGKLTKNPRIKLKKTTSDSLSKKRLKTIGPNDGIEKSRKLTEKIQTTRPNSSIGKPRIRGQQRSSTNKDELRICGNGKPMPPLSELEKMFEDTDDEESKPTTPKKCQTPNKTPVISEEKLKSPSTIKEIANKMMDFITNLPDATVLIPDEPPPPVIPPKKRKKPEEPYIVGCKDRPQVPYKPSLSFCKGDDDYGVDKNTNSENDDCPKRRAKRTKRVNLSKSLFNAKSDEIANWLKDCEKAEESDNSLDSNVTVEYEYSSNPGNLTRSFSPLPSTSRDSNTISKNDKRFNESLMNEKYSKKNIDSKNDVEIIDHPCETVIIDDEVDTSRTLNKPQNVINDTDDVIEIIDLNNKNESKQNDQSCNPVELIEIDDDCYNFVDINPINDIDTEIIDVDEVIAENKAIIDKYSKVEKINTITHVDSNTTEERNNENNSTTAVNTNFPNNPIEATNLLQDSNAYTQNNNVNKQNNDVCAQNQINQNRDSNQNSIPDEHVCKYANNTLFNNFKSWLLSFSNVRCCNNCNKRPKDLRATQSVIDEIIVLNDSFSFDNHNNNNNVSNVPQYNSETQSHRNSSAMFTSTPTRKRKRKAPSYTDNNSSVPKHVNESNIEPPPNKKSIGDCPICMDSLANNSIASTLCGHIFCMPCIKTAIKSSGKRCPTCRKSLKKGVGYHQIFL